MYTHEAPDPFRARHGSGEAIGRDQTAGVIDAPRAQPTIDLIAALEQAWTAICAGYDASAERPDTQCLLEGVNPKAPEQAAETVVANMLLDVMEHVGRFSPMYRQPMGLIHVRDRAHDRSRWLLSPELRQRWQAVLLPLARAIERNIGLVLAADVVGDLFEDEPCGEARVMAACVCVPPHVILVNRSVLNNAEIVCETCQRPFRPIESANE